MFHRSVVGPVASAALALAWLSLARPAAATYSIVVADAQTGQTGVAVASCVGAFDLAPLLRVVPGVGAVMAQSHTGFYGQTRLTELLGRGVAPARALALVTDPAFDPRRALRQYAVVDFWGRSAAFTGDGDGVWAGDRQGSFASSHYSAQGNLLTDADVLVALETGFVRSEACDLAERLMFALEAVVSVAGRGDRRCTPRGVSADSGYLRVAGMDGAALLELGVRDTGAVEPAVPLRRAYEAFRALHPCGSLTSQAVACPAYAATRASEAPRRPPPPARTAFFPSTLATCGMVGLALLVFLGQRARRVSNLPAIPLNRGAGS